MNKWMSGFTFYLYDVIKSVRLPAYLSLLANLQMSTLGVKSNQIN